VSTGGLFSGFGRKIVKWVGLNGFLNSKEEEESGGYHQKPSIYQHFSVFFWTEPWSGIRKNYICRGFAKI